MMSTTLPLPSKVQTSELSLASVLEITIIIVFIADAAQQFAQFRDIAWIKERF
jgi:hypothetical protein